MVQLSKFDVVQSVSEPRPQRRPASSTASWTSAEQENRIEQLPDDPKTLLTHALEKARKGEEAGAYAILQHFQVKFDLDSLAKASYSEELYYLLGKTFAMVGEFESAREQAFQLIQKDLESSYALELLKLADKYEFLADVSIRRPNESRKVYNERAIQTCSEFMESYPGEIDGYLKRAEFRMFQRRYQDAIDDLSTVILLAPTNPIGYQTRAQANIKLRQFSEALGDLDKVIELDSTSYSAFLDRAKCHKHLGNRVQATEDFKKVRELRQALKLKNWYE